MIKRVVWPRAVFMFLTGFLFLAVAGGASVACARETMQVTVLMPVGTSMVRFSLTSQDTRAFIERWSSLPRINAMVPIDEGSGYRGLLLRGSWGQEYRLYNGIIRRGNLARRDELRMLERWVLRHGPEDVVGPLIKGLDREVASSREDLAFPLVHNRSASAVVERCQEEGRLNDVARVNCLHRALMEQLPASEYADALEALVVNPPYMASGHERDTSDSERDGKSAR